MNQHAYQVGMISPSKNYGTLRRLIEEPVQLALSEICQ
jgi:hypothetical protein